MLLANNHVTGRGAAGIFKRLPLSLNQVPKMNSSAVAAKPFLCVCVILLSVSNHLCDLTAKMLLNLLGCNKEVRAMVLAMPTLSFWQASMDRDKFRLRMKNVILNFTRLECLNLSHNKLHLEDVQLIVNCMPKGLKQLTLAHNRLLWTGVQALGEYFSQSKLTLINLSFNYIVFNKRTVGQLRFPSTLQTLLLRGNHLHNKGVQVLLKTPFENLKTLDIGQNDMNVCVLPIDKLPKGLEELSVSNNLYGWGGRPLWDFSLCTKLTSLDLSHTDMTWTHLDYIVLGSGIQKLDVSNNRLIFEMQYVPYVEFKKVVEEVFKFNNPGLDLVSLKV